MGIIIKVTVVLNRYKNGLSDEIKIN